MKSTTIPFAALVAYAAAQDGYGAPAYGESSSSSSAATTSYACNPAHAYPSGQVCTEVGGSLTLVTTTGTATAPSYGEATTSAASTTYACNPAHSYPNGASCISTAGSLTLVTPSASSSSFLICNAAAIARGDCTATAASVPTTSASYACNPAHDYGNGASCISTAGTLSLVYPSATPSTTGSSGDCYTKYNACRVKPQANMASCASEYASCLGYNPFANNGTNTVTPAVGSDVYVTQVVTSFTTYCPQATTLTFGQKTYTVSSATTLTVTDCPGGCHVTTPVKSLPPSTTVTAVVSSFTTYCSEATTLTYNEKTYTVSKPSTLTVTDCAGGCTVTAPVSAITPPAQPSSYVPSGNGTTPSSPTGLTPYTGAAEKVMAGGSVILAAVAGVLFL